MTVVVMVVDVYCYCQRWTAIPSLEGGGVRQCSPPFRVSRAAGVTPTVSRCTVRPAAGHDEVTSGVRLEIVDNRCNDSREIQSSAWRESEVTDEAGKGVPGVPLYTLALRRSSFVLAVRRSGSGRASRFFVSLSNLY